MGLKQVLSLQSDTVKAVVSGTFSMEQAKKGFLEIIEFAQRHNSRKVLFDGRRIIGNLNITDRFYYGSFAAEQASTLSKAAFFAYVLKPPVLHHEKFGETVASNRGMAVKVFESLEEAVEWLADAKT